MQSAKVRYAGSPRATLSHNDNSSTRSSASRLNYSREHTWLPHAVPPLFATEAYLALLAEAYVRGGQANEAVPVLDEASAMVRNPRTFFYEAELYRLRGHVLMQAGAESLQDVNSCLLQALEAARRYATLSLELRAAVSLAHLWRDQGKHREARDLLIEVYGRFTEGLSTPDLSEAHAILQEIGAEQGGAAAHR